MSGYPVKQQGFPYFFYSQSLCKIIPDQPQVNFPLYISLIIILAQPQISLLGIFLPRNRVELAIKLNVGKSLLKFAKFYQIHQTLSYYSYDLS